MITYRPGVVTGLNDGKSYLHEYHGWLLCSYSLRNMSCNDYPVYMVPVQQIITFIFHILLQGVSFTGFVVIITCTVPTPNISFGTEMLDIIRWAEPHDLIEEVPSSPNNDDPSLQERWSQRKLVANSVDGFTQERKRF